MNKLREEFCKENEVPMGQENVYDYVEWLETRVETKEKIVEYIAGIWLPKKNK